MEGNKFAENKSKVKNPCFDLATTIIIYKKLLRFCIKPSHDHQSL